MHGGLSPRWMVKQMTLGFHYYRNARAGGISDDQKDHEFRAQRRFFDAVTEMRAAIEELNASSVVVEVEQSAFEDFLNDECPSPEYWADKLRDAN